jgi:hypothetical protein
MRARLLPYLFITRAHTLSLSLSGMSYLKTDLFTVILANVRLALSVNFLFITFMEGFFNF